MLQLARQNAAKGKIGQDFTNVEFPQTTIDKLLLPGASRDQVIINSVSNLAPDKPVVFREITRVRKPGGRLAYVGSIAGAILMDEYRRQLALAGFAAVPVIETGSDLEAQTKVEDQGRCCRPGEHKPPRGRVGLRLGVAIRP